MKEVIIYFIVFISIQISSSSTICVEGENFCSSCNPVTKLCEKCDKDVFILNESGECIGVKKCMMGNNYCIKCIENSYLCEVCEEGYFPDENGGCAYTNNCEISYRGECLKCKYDSILIGIETKICKSLYSENLKNCQKINIEYGFCESCLEGFYLNKGDNKCITVENCEESLFGVCKKCTGNHYLDIKENRCKQQKGLFVNCKETFNGIVCEICEDNYYFDEENKCVACNFCADGHYFRCDKCIYGYFLSEDKYSCTKDEYCYSGDKDFGICTKCRDGYYIDLKEGKCKSNKEEDEFKYCYSSDGNFCNDCIYKTYLGKDKKCSFSKNCSESESNICIECINNYHLDINNKCTNIEKCIYLDDDYNCIECENNYYFNKSSNKCEIEKENFKNCKLTTYDGDICGMCKDDFYYNKSDHLCYSNKEKGKFYKCAYTFNNGEYCIRCIKGYYLGYIDHKCSNIEGCEISENENKCLKCDSEYYCLDVKTGKCEYNDLIKSEDKKFYYKCNKTNDEGTSCESCLYGYFLKDNGLCYNDKYCLEKDKDGICNNCTLHDDNYDFLCLNSIFGCVGTYYSNCLKCNNIFNFDDCTECIEGYNLNEYNRCKKMENNSYSYYYDFLLK